MARLAEDQDRGVRPSCREHRYGRGVGSTQAVKIVVTGPFSAGKTQFIRTISEIDVVATERFISSAQERIKPQTTVAMDFGRITVDEDLVLYLFGTPGQRRFEFMWEVLSEGMLGFVVLLDSVRPETFREAQDILGVFRSYASVPYIVAANKQDLDDAWPPEDLRIALKIPQSIKMVPCVATDKESVKETLLALLYLVLEMMEETPEGLWQVASREEFSG